jgi:TatD DNase family protein
MSADLHAGGVDFHCHLDLYPDHEAAIARAEAAQVYTLAVTTTPKAWPRNHELTRATRYVRAALGLHPQLVAERAGELALWERHLPETRYVGEVGLDAGPGFYKSLEAQRDVFRTVLERCAAAGGKVLTVHSVRTAPMVLDMIERHLPRGRATVVLHWFSGSASDARRAASMGCYFSVNAEMTRSARGRSLIASLPMDRLLTETDGPFTNVDGRPAEPRDVEIAVRSVAEILDKPTSAISETIRSNLKNVLELRPQT